jgi:hypothetical protein
MAISNDNFDAERRAHIIRDYETAWSCIRLLETRINSLRQWSVMLFAAYVGFAATVSSQNTRWVSLFGIAVALGGFLFLEFCARASILFYFDSVERIDRLFSVENSTAFELGMKGHQFVSCRQITKTREDRHRRILKVLPNYQAWLWYVILLILVLLFTLVGIRSAPTA